jgi:hypothetical protein
VWPKQFSIRYFRASAAVWVIVFFITAGRHGVYATMLNRQILIPKASVNGACFLERHIRSWQMLPESGKRQWHQQAADKNRNGYNYYVSEFMKNQTECIRSQDGIKEQKASGAETLMLPVLVMYLWFRTIM